ncbi:MAG TPA: SDR family NAD(P)-dependent oxidoreductase [Candidatus Sulfopaludibacter sp.]|jgi:NAD(P)-dependent dehydrogenase (short-subunit alcohol dehydrogenase family)|nr:SDR family NAD(P)-dependent oxidoreductase [Candidatus Sulfopaludibacter sp.]
MSNILEGKVAVITGASRGLGKAMALALAGAGAKLALVARDKEKLEETAREAAALGAMAQVFIADVTDEAQVSTLAELVVTQFGRVDILINNAGTNIRKPLVEYSLEEWRKITDTNLTSVFLMCRAMIPHMKGRGYGRILNLTSIMSHISLPGRTAYSASKAGLLGLTRALAQELAPEAITVVGISPGPFATEMNTALLQNPEINQQFMSNTPLNRWGKVEEVGNLALFLCGEGGAYITGTDILIDGGWTSR